MAKRRKAVTDQLAVAPRPGAAPRAAAIRRGSQTPSVKVPQSGGSGPCVPLPTFTPVASTTAFGPPTDISAGWDGTLWAIDASGAPHLYDPSQNQWNPYGDGINAVAAVGNTLYLFRSGESLAGPSTGGQVIQVNLTNNQAGEPAPIGKTWPALPDSFKIGVTGAANLDGTLYLFKGGWYLPVSAPTQRAKLTALQGWPTTPNWMDGVIDAVVSNGSGVGMDGTVGAILTHGSECVVVDFKNNKVISGPAAIAEGTGWKDALPAGWLSGGWDGAVYLQHNGTTIIYVYRGPQVASFPAFASTVSQPQYIASIYTGWPATWNPVLDHAPSGRMGNLWAASSGAGQVLRHDGDAWNLRPGVARSTAAGQDNSVYAIGGDGGLYQWDGTQFNPQGIPSQLVQVSVGDDGHVWVRDSNAVYRYQGNKTFTPVDLGAGVPNPTHMSANAEGTLWHCNSGNANIFRLISESTNPSDTITVKGGTITSVRKVASTGFGAAHCLVTQNGQPQLYRYDSPYVFKTSETYKVALSTTGSFAQGLGNLYFVQFVSEVRQGQLEVRIVALDAHTGREVASYTPPGNTSQYSEVVFDPVNELVYVGRAPLKYEDDSTPGQIIALDARTLAMKWTFTTPGGIDATPALDGTTLCFGDRTAHVYCLDTKQALTAVAQNQPIPTRWTAEFAINGPVHRVPTPLFAGDQLFATMWDLEYSPGEGLSLLTTMYIRLSDGKSSGLSRPITTAPKNEIDPRLVLQPPCLGQLIFPGFTTPSRALIVCAATKIVAFNLDNDQQDQQVECPLPSGHIATCLIYDDGTRVGSALSNPDPSRTRLWFGDNQGNLWSLDNQLKPADGTPYLVKQKTEVYTTPVLYKDPQGGLTVLYGIFDSSGALPPSLYGYDPDNRNNASLPTGVTSISTLSLSVTNGVIYAGGSALSETGGNPVQVFGIRVDKLPQALRDFVIESQMMQDPDPNATGGSTDADNPIPPSVARYQTHLTVVDDQKSPLPHEPVKIWADKSVTITVEGQQFTVGPGDNDYAAVKTGVDGSLVIVSDATDMFASPLRVWASFMNSYERIVVNPDQEFHTRVTTAHANATDDDPDKVNLVTAHNYNAKPLFTPDEKNQQQPQNCANAIGQMNKGLGLGGGASKSTHDNVLRLARGERPAVAGKALQAPAPETYLAYADLRGASHFSTNIPAQRQVTIVSPVGLVYARPRDDKNSVPAFTAVHHSEALQQIDQLTGQPWSQATELSGHAHGTPRVGSIWSDFWNWLRHVVDDVVNYITHIIVAVAEEVVVGIRMMIAGVETVFKAIITVVEDIAAAIGSFFHMLAKAIEDLITALSVLFHFGEIIQTHNWIRDQINANLQKVADAMKNQVKPPVDKFFQQGEKAIEGQFKSIRQQLGITDDTQINDVNSARSTAHTVFTAGPGKVGANSGGSSHAVQCTHTTPKMKVGLPSDPQPLVPVVPVDDGQKLTGFVANFVASLENDPAIKTAFWELKNAIAKIKRSQSGSDFFKSALNLLLTIIEDLILGMVAVSQALVDGLIGAIEALVTTVKGLLNTPLNIPFISWLYHWLFGEQLTILNAVSLVAAIPVTIVYRVVEGHYPSKDGITGAETSAAPTGPQGTAPGDDVLKKMQGLVGGTLAGCLGVARAVVDMIGSVPDEDPRIAQWFVLGLSLCYVTVFFPLWLEAAPTDAQWAAWGFSLSLAMVGALSFITLADGAAKEVFRVAVPFLRAGLATARFIVFIVDFAKTPTRNAVTDVQFARNLFLGLPPGFNWLRLERLPPLIWLLAGIDVGSGVVVCALDITAGFLDTDSVAGTGVSVQHG